MYSLNNIKLESNSKIKINFDGGDLSSDPSTRDHKNHKNLLQVNYQILARYFNDNNANEPILNVILDKDGLASQPTLSRFFNRMYKKNASIRII